MNPSETNSISIVADASRRVLANDPIAPLAKRRTAAVLSTTFEPRREISDVHGRRRPDHRRLAHQQSRQVVQVGRLLDDLAAALFRPAPPGRTRRRVEPAGDDELRRRAVEPVADLGQDVERAEVVADGRR